MAIANPTKTSEPALWRLHAFGHERHTPGRAYWYDNCHRQPRGIVVAQITLAGHVLFREREREQLIGKGQMFLFAYGEPTAYGRTSADDPTYECRWVNLSGAGLIEHLQAFRSAHGSVLTVDHADALLGDMDQLIAIAGPRGEATATEAAAATYHFFTRLFEHARRQRRAALAPVEMAVEYISAYPTRVRSLKELADRFGCSREHLSRVFRQRSNQSPAAFLANARRRRAIELIAQTSLPLSAVAEQAGFSNRHAMTRQLRQITGYTATEIRENAAATDTLLTREIR